MNNKKIMQTTMVITVVLLISKVVGFLRDVAFAYAYGTSVNSDAFILAQSVISIFAAMLFTAIGLAFIPVYSKLKLNESAFELKEFVDSTYSVVGSIIVFICIIGFFFSDVLVFALAPGFTPETHKVAVTLTRILFPAILFVFISTIQGQQLRGNNIFMPSALISFPLNIALIISFLFLTPTWGIKSVAFAYVFGNILQIAILHPFVRRLDYNFHFYFNIKNQGLCEILILALPIMLGNTVQSIDILVNRILASGLCEGSMAALNFSNKLALFIVGIVSIGAGTVCYTKMSELGARKEFDELKKFLRSIINLVNLIIIPATIGMMVLNIPIIKFVYEYGAFNSSSSEMTATALWFYSIGLLGFVLRDIITKAFYAISDAKTPMINGGIAVIIGITFNLIFVRFLGIGGLALATSISGIIGTLLLLINLRKKIGQIGFIEIAVTFLKVCFASGAMGLTVHYLYPILLQATGILAIALLLDILCGIVIYGVIILFLKIKEVNYVIDYLKRHFLKKLHSN